MAQLKLVRTVGTITASTMGDDASELLLQPNLVHSMGQFSNLSYFIKYVRAFMVWVPGRA